MQPKNNQRRTTFFSRLAPGPSGDLGQALAFSNLRIVLHVSKAGMTDSHGANGRSQTQVPYAPVCLDALPRSECTDAEMRWECDAVSVTYQAAPATEAPVGFMLGTTTAGLAQTAQDRAPGQQMQDKGSVRGQPGASGYAPGQKMQDKGSKAGQPGASGYAPGQQDSTSGQGSRGGASSGSSKTR